MNYNINKLRITTCFLLFIILIIVLIYQNRIKDTFNNQDIMKELSAAENGKKTCVGFVEYNGDTNHPVIANLDKDTHEWHCLGCNCKDYADAIEVNDKKIEADDNNKHDSEDTAAKAKKEQLIKEANDKLEKINIQIKEEQNSLEQKEALIEEARKSKIKLDEEIAELERQEQAKIDARIEEEARIEALKTNSSRIYEGFKIMWNSKNFRIGAIPEDRKITITWNENLRESDVDSYILYVFHKNNIGQVLTKKITHADIDTSNRNNYIYTIDSLLNNVQYGVQINKISKSFPGYPKLVKTSNTIFAVPSEINLLNFRNLNRQKECESLSENLLDNFKGREFEINLG